MCKSTEPTGSAPVCAAYRLEIEKLYRMICQADIDQARQQPDPWIEEMAQEPPFHGRIIARVRPQLFPHANKGQARRKACERYWEHKNSKSIQVDNWPAYKKARVMG